MASTRHWASDDDGDSNDDDPAQWVPTAVLRCRKASYHASSSDPKSRFLDKFCQDDGGDSRHHRQAATEFLLQWRPPLAEREHYPKRRDCQFWHRLDEEEEDDDDDDDTSSSAYALGERGRRLIEAFVARREAERQRAQAARRWQREAKAERGAQNRLERMWSRERQAKGIIEVPTSAIRCKGLPALDASALRGDLVSAPFLPFLGWQGEGFSPVRTVLEQPTGPERGERTERMRVAVDLMAGPSDPSFVAYAETWRGRNHDWESRLVFAVMEESGTIAGLAWDCFQPEIGAIALSKDWMVAASVDGSCLLFSIEKILHEVDERDARLDDSSPLKHQGFDPLRGHFGALRESEGARCIPMSPRASDRARNPSCVFLTETLFATSFGPWGVSLWDASSVGIPIAELARNQPRPQPEVSFALEHHNTTLPVRIIPLASCHVLLATTQSLIPVNWNTGSVFAPLPATSFDGVRGRPREIVLQGGGDVLLTSGFARVKMVSITRPEVLRELSQTACLLVAGSNAFVLVKDESLEVFSVDSSADGNWQKALTVDLLQDHDDDDDDGSSSSSDFGFDLFDDEPRGIDGDVCATSRGAIVCADRRGLVTLIAEETVTKSARKQ